MNLPDYTNCTLCPRMCHVNRSVTIGYCGCSSHISAARSRPFINGGTGAQRTGRRTRRQRRCLFLRLYLTLLFLPELTTKQDHFGKKLTVNELGDAFLRLQDKGAYNINLVTPTQFFPRILLKHWIWSATSFISL